VSNYFTDYLIDFVRGLLRQHEPFASMSRDDIDNNVLADLNATFQCELESWITEMEHKIRDEIKMDLEIEAEIEREAKAKKKVVRAKPQAVAP
jgi:hypothetical protein